MSDQPLLTGTAIASFVSAIIGLLVSFGVPVTSEQQAAIMSLVAAAAPWIVWYLAKSRVTALSNPKDATGAELTRFDGSAARTKKDE